MYNILNELSLLLITILIWYSLWNILDTIIPSRDKFYISIGMFILSIYLFHIYNTKNACINENEKFRV